MKKFIGIDLGSRLAKIVVFQNGKIIYQALRDTGVNPQKTSQILLDDAISHIQDDKFEKIYTTGYGRNIVPFSQKRISEISCHAMGVHHYFPKAAAIIDIGGQDSKGILKNSDGKVTDFVMNDRCAAGTGKFLEVAATTLETTVDKLGELAISSSEDLGINSTCVVFAESEIIGLIAEGKQKSEIAAAIHRSIAKRTKNLIARLHWQKPVVFTGGVAKNIGMQNALTEVLKTELLIPENSFFTGALGAAIFASRG